MAPDSRLVTYSFEDSMQHQDTEVLLPTAAKFSTSSEVPDASNRIKFQRQQNHRNRYLEITPYRSFDNADLSTFSSQARTSHFESSSATNVILSLSDMSSVAVKEHQMISTNSSSQINQEIGLSRANGSVCYVQKRSPVLKNYIDVVANRIRSWFVFLLFYLETCTVLLFAKLENVFSFSFRCNVINKLCTYGKQLQSIKLGWKSDVFQKFQQIAYRKVTSPSRRFFTRISNRTISRRSSSMNNSAEDTSLQKSSNSISRISFTSSNSEQHKAVSKTPAQSLSACYLTSFSWSSLLLSSSFLSRKLQFITRPSCPNLPYLRASTRKWCIARWSTFQLMLLLLCLPKDVLGGQNERRLLNDLLQNYNTQERPVANESNPVEVSFGITLQQIIDVDEKNQLLMTNTWLKLEWNDVNLKWNVSDYGGVSDIRMSPYKVWKPDVLMYNSADEGFDGTYQTKVVVYNSGNCLYIPPGIFKSTCKIDITWFPFDDQKCKMKFGSWTYSGWQLDLKLQSEEGGDLSDFTKNGEWDLIGCPGKRNVIYYQCCPEPYVDVTFEIMIRRRTLYYFCNLILPCVLIASMAVLGFTLPPDCGEKLSLGVAVLLSLCVFSELVNNTLPQTSDAVPLLGTYFNCIMFMVASSVVSTVLILNYHHRSADTHEMSPMVRSMFLQWLPWVLRMHRPGEKITRKTIMMNNKMKELELKPPPSFQERSSKSLLANVLDIDDDFRAHTLPHPGHNTNNSTGPGGIIRIPHSGHSVDDSHLVHTCMSQCTRELNLILKEIRVITDKMRNADDELEVRNDWRFAAMVVDRMCLIVFTLFTITATVAVLFSAPHIMMQ